MTRNKSIFIAESLAVMLLACCLTSCAQVQPKSRPGTADHEIVTLTPVAEDKMMITIRGTDGVQVEYLEQGIEEHFPEVDIVFQNNTWVQADLTHGCAQDILLVNGNVISGWHAPEYLIDLSGKSYLQNYYLSALQSSESDNGIYYLPGPSNIYGIVYNKDMFDQHGWEVPKNLDEFITLCATIEETGIRAIQPALYYKDATRQFFTGFTYEPTLSGVENSAWLADYRIGNTSMTGHMEPAFEIMERFIDEGILRAGDFETRPSERSDMLYRDHTCAMILETQDAVNYALRYNRDIPPTVAMMPFFSGNGPDSDYLLAVPNYLLCVNKDLEQQGNEEKLSKVNEILAFLSTAEGQKAVTPPDSTMISSIRGMAWNNSAFLNNVTDTIQKGAVVQQPYFVGNSNTEVDTVLKSDLLLLSQDAISPKQCMEDLDAARNRVLSEKQQPEQNIMIGSAAEDFTVLQTAQLFADIFREKSNAQIGLCLANTKYQGCNYRIYAGDLVFSPNNEDTLDWVIQSGFLANNIDDNGQKLMRFKVTGKNLLQTLEYPNRGFYADAYWTASGLKITFAPWAGEGKRIVSAVLADGTPIDPEAVYTVAAWNGSVNPELILEVEEYYDNSVTDLFRSRVESQGSIKPELDDSFILDWETVSKPESSK